MNEIKYWAIGGRWFVNFFGSIVLPADSIGAITFAERVDGFTAPFTKTPVARVFDTEGLRISSIPDRDGEGYWEFEGEQRDKLLEFCNDEDK